MKPADFLQAFFNRRMDKSRDKYLKVTRVIKRRTFSNEFFFFVFVQINGRPAKASAEVKTGDQLTIQFGNKDVSVEVLDVQETIHKEDASQLFRYI